MKINFNVQFLNVKYFYQASFHFQLSLLISTQQIQQKMITSPFIEQVNSCRSLMKKLRKKIYKYNINQSSKYQREEPTTITHALNVLQKRAVPQFLMVELQKLSGLSFGSITGFSMEQFRSVDEVIRLSRNQETQAFDMYQKNKRAIKKRKSKVNGHNGIVRMSKKASALTSDGNSAFISSTSIADELEFQERYEEQSNISENESSCSSSYKQQSNPFEPINNMSNQFDQDFNNSDAMFQSTMLDFGNQIEMDSEEFLFK